MNNKEMLFQALQDGKIDDAAKLIKINDRELQNEEIQDILLDVSVSKQSIVPYVVITKLFIAREKNVGSRSDSANRKDYE